MDVKFNKEEQGVPIKFWLKNRESIEDGAWGQAIHMANLPFTYKHIALMADVHQGYGVPIGGVMVLDNVIIPHAVGVDISCGVQALELDVQASKLREVQTGSGPLGKMIAGQIMRNIPLGFNKHSEPQWEGDLDWISSDIDAGTWGYDQLREEGEFENARLQLGTLGSGNHFIELQEDLDSGKLWIMVHSGSRHLGYTIAKMFNEKAKELNKKWFTKVPEDWDLAFLPADHKIGQAYLDWMNFASEYAKRNRHKMLDQALKDTKKCFINEIGEEPFVSTPRIECNHNYANLENHFGKNVYVHRKGAIRVREGEDGIIPGSMGSYSYIVAGKGKEQSFHSASHGAGRKMSRNEAKRQFDVRQMLEEFRKDEMYLMTPNNKKEVLDEYTGAYKNVVDVMDNQKDLVDIKSKLKTVSVIKG